MIINHSKCYLACSKSGIEFLLSIWTMLTVKYLRTNNDERNSIKWDFVTTKIDLSRLGKGIYLQKNK